MSIFLLLPVVLLNEICNFIPPHILFQTCIICKEWKKMLDSLSSSNSIYWDNWKISLKRITDNLLSFNIINKYGKMEYQSEMNGQFLKFNSSGDLYSIIEVDIQPFDQVLKTFISTTSLIKW